MEGKGHRQNFLDDFEKWMIRTGKKPRKREIPSEPMAPIGARAKLRSLRRILVDLSYIHSEKLKKRKFKYSVWPKKGCKRIDDIKPEDFMQWINQQFPSCQDRKEKQNKAAYVMAAWKFGEYLVYEKKDHNGKPIWIKEQLKHLKEITYPPTIEKFKVETLPLEKIDAFIEFIETRNFMHYTMVYLSRWLGGMRYQEIIRAPADLNSPTLKINFKTGYVEVHGKGKGGMQKPRWPGLEDHVKETLKQYIEYRKELIKKYKTRKKPIKKDPGYFFFNQYGKKFAENSGHFNTALRNHARAWGKLTEEEIALISTHKIGRHCFATYWHPRIPEGLLMEEMGLEDHKMLYRYSDISREQRTSIMKEARTKDNNNSVQPQPRTDRLSQLKELFSGLSKEEKLQLLAEVIG